MRMKLICSGLAVLLLQTAFAQENLPSFKAPLTKTETGREYTGAVKLDRKRLTFSKGSKKVVFQPDGTFAVFSGGRELARVHLFISTPFKMFQRNIGIRKSAGKYDGTGMQIREIRTTEDSIVFEGLIPWNGAGQPLIAKKWKIEAKIEDGRRVRIQIEYEPAAGVKLPTDSGIFFSFINAAECIAGKLGSWVPGEKTKLYSYKPADIQVRFANEADSITVTPTTWWRAWPFGSSHLRQDFIREKMVLYIDPGRGFEETPIRSASERLKVLDDLTVPARGKNLLPNPYFASPYRFRRPGDFSITDPKSYYSTDAKFGRYSIRLPENQAFTAAVPLDPGDYVFSFYAKGPGAVHLGMWTAGKAFGKYAKVKVDSPDRWVRREVAFHFPVENALTFRARSDSPLMLIDGMQLERGKKATAFEAPAVEACRTDALFYPSGKDLTLEFELSTLEKEVSGSGEMTIRNFFGETVAKQKFDYKVSAGKYPKITFKPGKLPDGIYVVRLDYGGRAPEQFFRLAVMPFLENKHLTARVFSPRYDSHLPVRTAVSEDLLVRMRAIGIGIIGHSRAIDHATYAIYKKYGVIPFDLEFDGRGDSDVIKKLMPELKNVPPGHMWFHLKNKTVGYRHPKSATLPDYRLVGGWNEEYRKKFIETLKTELRKFPEYPAYFFGSEAPHEVKDDPHYPDAFAAFREAVKSVYPNAWVYDGGEPSMNYGSPGGGVDYCDKMLKRLTGKARSDFVNAHTYTKNVRQLYRNFRGLVNMMKKHPDYADSKIALAEGMHFYPYHIAAWNTEHVCWCGEGWQGGSPSYDLGWHERLSAAYFARAWLIFLTEYHRLWCACSSAVNTGNFVLDVSLSPRAFQKIPNTLGVLLGNPKRYIGDFTFAPDTKCLVWEDEHGYPLAAVWNEDAAVDSGYKDAPKAKLNYPGAEYIDLMGAKRRPPKDGEFAVSSFPLFIRGKKGDFDKFTKALSVAVLDDPDRLPCHIGFEILPGNRVRLTLLNQVSRELNGTLRIFGKDHAFKIPKTSETSLIVPLPKPVRADRVDPIPVPYTCRIGSRVFSGRLKLYCFEVKKFTGDWSKVPVIKLTNKAGRTGFSEADFSATYQIAWDEKKLRLRVRVRDNVFSPGSEKSYRWNYDVLQVYFDTRCSALKTGTEHYDEDDYEYGFMPTPDGKSCEVWRALSPDIQLTFGIAAPKNNTFATEIPAKFTRTADGYIYDVEFPADYLLPMKLMKGYNFAFGLLAGDKDDGKGMAKALSNTSKPGTGCYNQPHLWPIAILTE